MGRAAVIVLGLSLTSSCLSPTEIVLELSTNVMCSFVALNGVAIAIGAPGSDMTSTTTTAMTCSSDGGIGSLVVVPSGSSEGEIGIRVTLGVGVMTDQCAGPSYTGCIVARRALRYNPHTPLTLPIELDQACESVGCSADSTCVAGTCVDASVGPCTGVCNVEDAGPPPMDAATDAPPPAPSVIMFGGSSNCDPTAGTVPVLDDTWSWDGTNWTQLDLDAVTPPQPGEYLFSMPSAGSETLIFGGFDTNDTFLSTTYLWNGMTWVSETITTIAPPTRAFSAMALLGPYMVLFGGCESGNCEAQGDVVGDTWLWNTTLGWNSLTFVGPPPPPARLGHAMATSGTSIVLFGGTPYYGATDLYDTWTFDGSAWAEPTTTITMHPSGRDGHSMAAAGSSVVLFGGEYYTSNVGFTPDADTWLWNGTNWSIAVGAMHPTARYYASMATFGDNQAVLFGGWDGTKPLGDTWVWNGTGWVQQFPATLPPARCGHGMWGR